MNEIKQYHLFMWVEDDAATHRPMSVYEGSFVSLDEAIQAIKDWKPPDGYEYYSVDHADIVTHEPDGALIECANFQLDGESHIWKRIN